VRRVIFLAVLAASVPARAEMMCDSGPMPPQGVSTQTKVAGSGGVIVAGNTLPDWRFRDINRVVRPRVTKVAPGLAIYHPPPVADPDLTLEDTSHGARVRKPRALKADPALPAPKLERVTYRENGQARGVVTAELAERSPKTAVILVIVRVDGTKRTPMSWARVRADGTAAFPVWHTPYTCEPRIDATIAPKPGETVEVMWLDESGRISEPSNAVAIVRAKEPK
jgi:hypothetical protein